MLDVCLLGTGGMMPLAHRWLTSCMIRFNGKIILIDCGEGTQIAIQKYGWSFKNIDAICFTHFHGDHISGLPGILLAMANSDRAEPVVLAGPKGLSRVVRGLRVIVPELPFEVNIIEFESAQQTIELCGCRVTAFKVNHNMYCLGYTVEVGRIGKFDPERAKAQDIPLKYWNPLQKGMTITDGDREYTPEMVLGKARKGLKVTYCTDTRPTVSIVENAYQADLFICEGMYGEEEKAQKAKENKHMTMQEGALLAVKADVKRLWFTHYSPSMTHPEWYMKEIKEIFPGAVAARDGQTIELNFEDEEE